MRSATFFIFSRTHSGRRSKLSSTNLSNSLLFIVVEQSRKTLADLFYFRLDDELAVGRALIFCKVVLVILFGEVERPERRDLRDDSRTISQTRLNVRTKFLCG